MLDYFRSILAHNYNEQSALHRAMQAKAIGLPEPEKYASVLPGSNQTETNNVTINNSGAGMLKGAILGTALLVGGGGTAAGLAKILTGAPTAPTTAVPAQEASKAEPATTVPPVAVQKQQAWDAIYEEKQADGTWKQVKRERLKTNGR